MTDNELYCVCQVICSCHDADERMDMTEMFCQLMWPAKETLQERFWTMVMRQLRRNKKYHMIERRKDET